MSGDISRRLTLGWVAAASAGALAMAGCETLDSARRVDPPPGGEAPRDLWKDAELEPLQAPGYGPDPNLIKPAVPWPLTLDAHQRDGLRIAADLVLPAEANSPSGGALRLDAFIDEWVSAPYPQQHRDRVVIVSGLQWLDAEAKRRFQVDFTRAADAQRRAIFDAIAFRGRIAPGQERPAQFFARLRGLMLAGYYSAPEGVADLGYIGNKPIAGDYPGPSEDAMANLNASLTKLGLKTAG